MTNNKVFNLLMALVFILIIILAFYGLTSRQPEILEYNCIEVVKLTNREDLDIDVEICWLNGTKTTFVFEIGLRTDNFYMLEGERGKATINMSEIKYIREIYRQTMRPEAKKR
jgi:hypothetical protein